MPVPIAVRWVCFSFQESLCQDQNNWPAESSLSIRDSLPILTTFFLQSSREQPGASRLPIR